MMCGGNMVRSWDRELPVDQKMPVLAVVAVLKVWRLTEKLMAMVVECECHQRT